MSLRLLVSLPYGGTLVPSWMVSVCSGSGYRCHTVVHSYLHGWFPFAEVAGIAALRWYTRTFMGGFRLLRKRVSLPYLRWYSYLHGWFPFAQVGVDPVDKGLPLNPLLLV